MQKFKRRDKSIINKLNHSCARIASKALFSRRSQVVFWTSRTTEAQRLRKLKLWALKQPAQPRFHFPSNNFPLPKLLLLPLFLPASNSNRQGKGLWQLRRAQFILYFIIVGLIESKEPYQGGLVSQTAREGEQKYRGRMSLTRDSILRPGSGRINATIEL